MDIFDKGSFLPITNEFKQGGLSALEELTGFQEKFPDLAGGDTDTTVNSIRDAIIASYLGFPLLNASKHGFDAKTKDGRHYLEIKQCSVSSGRWGGTWNDTNEEKARAFSDERLFTAVAIWKGASNLQFIVYGRSCALGEYLLDRVQNRKPGSRSTQNVPIAKLLGWGFSIIVPPGRDKQDVTKQIVLFQRSLAKILANNPAVDLHEYKTPIWG